MSPEINSKITCFPYFSCKFARGGSVFFFTRYPITNLHHIPKINKKSVKKSLFFFTIYLENLSNKFCFFLVFFTVYWSATSYCRYIYDAKVKSLTALDGVLTPWWLLALAVWIWYSPRVPTATQMLPFGEEVEGMSDGNWIWPSARRDRHSLCKNITAGSPAYANSGSYYICLQRFSSRQTWRLLIGWCNENVFTVLC